MLIIRDAKLFLACIILVPQQNADVLSHHLPKGAIKKGQFRETGNILYRRRRKTKQKHNTICVGHHYTQTNTNNVNKTCTLLQATFSNVYLHMHMTDNSIDLV
jgi:hypothetical protein